MKENPIDKDKVAENPGTLPYPHTVGGFKIEPVDKGRAKGLAITAMEQQTDIQMNQIYKQMELLANQAKDLQNRRDISQKIYLSEINFEPVIGHIYHLYEKTAEIWIMSLVAPHEWGRRGVPYDAHLATVKLLADHTWEVVQLGKDFE